MDNEQIDIWNQAGEKAWQAVLDGVRTIRDQGVKLDTICEVLGVKSKAQMSEWIKGNRTAVNAPFGCMLRYLAALGYNPRDFVPSPSGQYSDRPPPKAVTKTTNCATCRKLKDAEKETVHLRKQIENLKHQLAKKEGQVELLLMQAEKK